MYFCMQQYSLLCTSGCGLKVYITVITGCISNITTVKLMETSYTHIAWLVSTISNVHCSIYVLTSFFISIRASNGSFGEHVFCLSRLHIQNLLLQLNLKIVSNFLKLLVLLPTRDYFQLILVFLYTYNNKTGANLWIALFMDKVIQQAMSVV